MFTKLFYLTFALLTNFLISLCIFAQAQITTFPATGSTLQQSIKVSDPGAGQITYTWNPAMYKDIGRADDQDYYNRYRMRTVLYFGSIPRDARINSVKLTLTIWNYTAGSTKARIVKLPANYSDDPTAWSQFDSPSTVYFTNLQYDQMSYKDLTSSTFTSDVTSAINSTNQTFTFGIMSLNEGTNSTNAEVFMSVTVNWTPAITVIIQNSFSGGTVEVDGESKNSPWTSGQSGQLKWYSGDSHTIRAFTQTDGSGKEYPFPEPGTWNSTCGQTKSQTNNNTPVSISPTTNCTMTAMFGQPTVQITAQNDFGGGYFYEGTDVNNLTQYSSPTTFTMTCESSYILKSENQSYTSSNGKTYYREFQNWLKDGTDYSTDNPLTITASGASMYTAHFHKIFNFEITTAIYPEGGSGGTYQVIYNSTTNTGTTWSGTVKEGSSITIQANPPTNYFFACWSDGAFTNPRTMTPTDHVTGLYAIYKRPQKSNTFDATSTSSQRKIVMAGNTKYMVYQSAGSIWYSSDEGSGWSNEVPISISTTAKNPCIATTYGPPLCVHIVWEDTTNDGMGTGGHEIFYRRSTDYGVTWEAPISIGNIANWAYADSEATPVVSGDSYPVVAWRYFGGIAIKVAPANQYSPSWQGVPNTDEGSKSPAIDVKNGPKLVFVNSQGQIIYQPFSINGNFITTFENSINLTSGFTYMNNFRNPSIACYFGDRVYVCWDAIAGGKRQIFMRERDGSNVWLQPVQFIHGTHAETNPTVGVDLQANKVTVVWDCYGFPTHHIARATRSISSSIWSDICDLGQGYNPSILPWTAYWLPQYVLWTSGTATPYSIKTGNISTAPAQPILLSPENQVEIGGNSAYLQWRAVFNTAKYWLQVSTESNFASTICDDSTLTNASYPLNDLSYATTYYWRVRAINEYGTSITSDVWSFTTPQQGGQGGGCPYVFSWDGSSYIEENNILPQSEYEENKDKSVNDYYKLLNSPILDNGNYLLELREFEHERSRFDRIKLIAVDHDSNSNIAVLPDGKIVEYIHPFKLVENEQCSKLAKMDKDVMNVSKEEQFQLEFEPLTTEYELWEYSKCGMLLGGSVRREHIGSGIIPIDPPPEKKRSVGSINLTSGSVSGASTSFTFRERPTLVYVPLSAIGTPLNVCFTDDVVFDYASLVVCKDSPTYKLQELNLSEAYHSIVGNVTNRLATQDDVVEELKPGESVRLKFVASSIEAGKKRSFVLAATGRYEGINENESLPMIPNVYKLCQNQPNPFNPTTLIKYELPKYGYVSLKVYDILGREMANLVDGYKDAGYYTIEFDASKYSSGVYFYKLQSGDFVITKKMLLAR